MSTQLVKTFPSISSVTKIKVLTFRNEHNLIIFQNTDGDLVDLLSQCHLAKPSAHLNNNPVSYVMFSVSQLNYAILSPNVAILTA